MSNTLYRSKDTALLELAEMIQKILDEKEVAVCALIHIEGGFDNTCHEAVKRALEIKGVDTLTSR